MTEKNVLILTNENAADIPGVFQGRSIRIVTPRLDIAPLTYDEAQLYLTDVDAYADALGLSEPPLEPDPDTRKALNWLIEVGLTMDRDMFVYGAIWALVDRASLAEVGNACFKGAPIDAEAEIGYGVDEPYRNRGYMTEAVRGFVAWGKTRDDIVAIVAETLKGNIASQRVLAANGFTRSDDDSPEFDAYFWRRALS